MTAVMRRSSPSFGWYVPQRLAVVGLLLVGSAAPAPAQSEFKGDAAGAGRPLLPKSGATGVPQPESRSPGAGLLSPNLGSPALGAADAIGPSHGELPSIFSPLPGAPAAGFREDSAARVGLQLSAQFGQNGSPVTGGLMWRIYGDRPDGLGQFPLVAEDSSPSPKLNLPPGDYVVHVSLGLASAVRRVRLQAGTVRAAFEIPAGGIRLEGRVGGIRIPPEQIFFDIFPGSQFDPGEKQPLARQVTTGQVVMVPEGTYHFVSQYGDANAVIRSDIRVQAGRLTEVTVTHHAAVITLKLVNERGGEALADTAWSVLTPGGDIIMESVGAFPRVVLAEGEYHVIARNEGNVFERGFKVSSGVDGEVEVLAR
jgi:hypothetical protein